VHTVPVGRTSNAFGDPPQGARHRSRLTHGAATQRDRLVAAMGELVAELGGTTIGVHHVCQRAGVSRRTFYDLYADRDGCLVETLEAAYGQLLAHVGEAVADAGVEWEDRTVAATQALLVAFEADRVLAHLCLMPAAGGHRDALRLRRAAIGRIAALLTDAPAPALPCEPVLAGALGGVWELALRSLTDEPEASIEHLAGSAIYLMLAPFVGRRQASSRAAGRGSAVAYVTRWRPTVAGDLDDRGLLVTELTGDTLCYLAKHPGAANVEVSRALDVRHESQMSRHLVRLERAGMVARRKEGRTNAWRLTAQGEEAARSLRELRTDAPRMTTSAWASTGMDDA
jgi:AcrR family transcriptional regulator/DNA-binding transcriptional ArsR family regulator